MGPRMPLEISLSQASGYQARQTMSIPRHYVLDFSLTRKQQCQWPDIRPLGKKQIPNCFASLTTAVNEGNEQPHKANPVSAETPSVSRQSSTTRDQAPQAGLKLAPGHVCGSCIPARLQEGVLQTSPPHEAPAEVLGYPHLHHTALAMQRHIPCESLAEGWWLLAFLCKSRHMGLEQQQLSARSLCSALCALGSTVKLKLG